MDRSWEQRLMLVKYIFNLRGGIWVGTEFLCFCVLLVVMYTVGNGQIGLRWRPEKEVTSGKGQTLCGNKHCDVKDGLASYEVMKLGKTNKPLSNW
ncbi:uncharacterized protein LOC126598995 isoform X2 [Malus sylvestris]|nr:uncharacterized protein LOC126598995 isoform X2 [Malus sylvestris]